MSELPITALILWATIAGLDLASVLQGLLNRPLVAGGIAGGLIGDPVAGLAIGGSLELFALDVLPVGSARYPDYGAATVAAVAYGAGQPWPSALGLSVLVGLALGLVGGWTAVVHRRANARALRRLSPALERGDAGVPLRLHLIGLAGDLVRSGGLALLGLGMVLGLLQLPRIGPAAGQALTVVTVAGGLVAMIGGALRRAGTVRRMAWLGAGLAAGALTLGLR